MNVVKPNFLIVGAAKSGTTSLYMYLNQHPEVFMPKGPVFSKKEPHFFVPEVGLKTWQEYSLLFSEAQYAKAIGEASTGYLYSAMAPERICNFLGDKVKIVIILRNPIDMAYSLWKHMVREGKESLSFFEALSVESERINSVEFKEGCQDWVFNFAYIDRAKYAIQVERYMKVFGAERVKLYIYEEFFSYPEFYFRDLCNFLEVDTSIVPQFKVYNSQSDIKSKWLKRILNDVSLSWREPVKKVWPVSFRIWIKAHLNQLNQKRSSWSPLSEDERGKLGNLFADDVLALEKMTALRVSEIWNCD